MVKNIETIFAPLKATIEAQPLTLADLMELIGSFAQSHPVVGAAMAFNARDIYVEHLEGKSNTDTVNLYSQFIAEVYRRTFFNEESARRYGTADMLDSGEETLRGFADFVTASYAMEDRQIEAGSFHEAAKNQ